MLSKQWLKADVAQTEISALLASSYLLWTPPYSFPPLLTFIIIHLVLVFQGSEFQLMLVGLPLSRTSHVCTACTIRRGYKSGRGNSRTCPWLLVRTFGDLHPSLCVHLMRVLKQKDVKNWCTVMNVKQNPSEEPWCWDKVCWEDHANHALSPGRHAHPATAKAELETDFRN